MGMHGPPFTWRLHLCQDLLAHTTVRNRADILFGVKVIWESEIDLAGLVECLYLFR